MHVKSFEGHVSSWKKNNFMFIKILNYWLKKQDPFYEIFMKGRKVLDVGCGKGDLLKKDKENFVGIDLNEGLVDKLKMEGLNVSLASATAIPFADNSFDVVNCRHVIEHLHPEDARKMIIEMKRVLRGGGVIILSTPTAEAVWNTFGHIKPYTPTAIKKLFLETSLESFDSVSGLKIEQVIYLGRWSTNKLSFLISTLLANVLKIAGGMYIMIVKKYEN